MIALPVQVVACAHRAVYMSAHRGHQRESKLLYTLKLTSNVYDDIQLVVAVPYRKLVTTSSGGHGAFCSARDSCAL